eukprot:TRINITY_DN4043_c2_g1_i1.p1 TRINITY_DN4043_c2_g1~~TRINITY_DN4043_c2_g1_i1.p1  ORF type:complete len:294 (+),score=71.87 TRINITY_DN4043_c2_g1_i1:143-1024(+)
MEVCSACNADFYHNPQVRTLFSAVCDHRLCEPCWKRLFQRGKAYSCPGCGLRLRAEDWSEQPREAKQLESETQIRRRICEIYCKGEQDFASSDEFNDYLEMREDIVFRLANPASKAEERETWQMVEKYQEENAALILQAKELLQRRKAQKVHDIIATEGTFFCSVNSEWGERERGPSEATPMDVREAATPQKFQHPFQVRYRDLLLLSEEGPNSGGAGLLQTPSRDRGYGAPQPMTGGAFSPVSPGYIQKDPVRHANGGGQVPGADRRKARHYFFADLAAAFQEPASKAVFAA